MSGNRNSAAGADYSQGRRNKVSSAREDLDSVIPEQYFSGELARNNTTYPPDGKLQKAAANYITDLRQELDDANAEIVDLKERVEAYEKDEEERTNAVSSSFPSSSRPLRYIY